MFTKNETDGSFRPGALPPGRTTSPQVANPAASGGGVASVIGADLSVTGTLEFKGELQVEGDVQGDIHAQRLAPGDDKNGCRRHAHRREGAVLAT